MKVARMVLTGGKSARIYLSGLGFRRFSITKPSLNKDYLAFVEWFRGFTDAEGSFGFSKGIGNKFEFIFEIDLHIDDKGVLDYIHNTLQIGKVYTIEKRSKARFVVRLQDEQAIII